MGVPQHVRICRDCFGAFEPRSERFLDVVCVVTEVEHERVVFIWVNAVQPRQGLHRVQPSEGLVDVHRVQQRLIETGLELLRNDQHLILVGVETLRCFGIRESVHPSFGELGAIVEHFAGERHQRLQVRVLLLPQVLIDGLFVTHSMQPAGGDHHCFRVPTDFGCGVLTEMLNDDLSFLRQVRWMQRHEPRNRSFRAGLVMVRVVRNSFLDTPVRLVRRVVLQHVMDEAFLDRLTH